MRPYQIFAGMPPDHALRFFQGLSEHAPAAFQQALLAACAALKSRPSYLRKQPFERRAEAVRRSLSRVAADAVAEEMLAVYFLEARKPLLIEWLDAAGVAHEEGTLKEDTPPEPKPAKLRKAVEAFRGAEDDPDRTLLLRAFSAQSSIEWPKLEELLASSAA